MHEIIEHPKWLGFFLHKFVTWSAQNIIAVSAAVNENIKKNVDNKGLIDNSTASWLRYGEIKPSSAVRLPL